PGLAQTAHQEVAARAWRHANGVDVARIDRGPTAIHLAAVLGGVGIEQLRDLGLHQADLVGMEAAEPEGALGGVRTGVDRCCAASQMRRRVVERLARQRRRGRGLPERWAEGGDRLFRLAGVEEAARERLALAAL